MPQDLTLRPGTMRLSRRGLLAVVAAAGLSAAPALAQSGPAADGGWGATLTAHTGARVGGETLKGRPYAVYFGYTHCPDVCPTSMSDMTEILARLGDAAKDFRVYFVTVDPERDTLPLLAVYLGENFDPRIIGLSGTSEEIAAVARTFRAIYRKEGGGEGYAISHTASTFLVDRHGRIAGRLPHGGPIEPKITRIAALIRE